MSQDDTGEKQERRDFFISYTGQDKPWAEWIAAQLDAAGYTFFFQAWDFRPGSNFVAEMDNATRQADRTLLVLSAAYLASGFAFSEWAAAFRQDPAGSERHLLPVRIEPCELGGLLAQVSYLDLVGYDAEQARERLLKGIQTGRARPAHVPFPGQQIASVAFPGTFPAIWNIPIARNPFFTGREDLLEQLHTHLQTTQAMAISQPQAISGLGGIGKTQLAIEYAYRYRGEYQAILWVRADTTEALNEAYTEIAGLLQLPQKEALEQKVIVQAVKHWLRGTSGWLLILDNADEPDLVSSFLPTTTSGNILLTTRATDVSAHIAGTTHSLVVDTFSDEQGALFLLLRSGLLALDAPLDQAETQTRQLAREIAHELGGLPLALDQAGAYLKVTGCSLAVYQQIYQKRRAQLLGERRGADHPDPVATTWKLSFECVEMENPAAADLLRLCAFLAPDAIPEEIVTQGAEALGPLLESVAADAYLFNQAIQALRAYSLVTRDSDEQTLTIHRLVQAVLNDAMKKEEQGKWAERAVRVVERSFPQAEGANLFACEWYLSHALLCSEHIKHWNMNFFEARELLFRVGHYYYQRVLYVDAEPHWKYSLTLSEQVLGPDHYETASRLVSLANLYTFQDKYEQAEPLYERALLIHERVLGSDDLTTAGTIQNLGVFYERQGKYEQAELFYRRALTTYERVLGPNHPQMAMPIQNLATLYADLGRDEQAEPLYQRALAICEQKPEPDDPGTALVCYNLATIYEKQGKYEQAETLYQRALTIREQILGIDHLTTMQNLQQLIIFYVDRGSYEQADLLYQRYEQADLLYQQVRTIGERLPEPDRLHAAKSFHDLALHCAGLGEYERAESLYQRSLALYEQGVGPYDPSIAANLSNLANLYLAQGKYDQAEPLYQRALAVYERVLEPNHPYIVDCLYQLANLYLHQKKYEKAEPLYNEVLAIYERQVGAEHSEIAFVLSNLALLYQNQGRYQEAEMLYVRALAICEQQFGTEHPYTQTMMSNYLRLLSEIYTGGDLDALLQLLAQKEPDDDKDEETAEEPPVL